MHAFRDRQLPPSPPGSDRKNSFLPCAGLSLPGLSFRATAHLLPPSPLPQVPCTQPGPTDEGWCHRTGQGPSWGSSDYFLLSWAGSGTLITRARVLTEGPLGPRAPLMSPQWLLITPHKVDTICTPDTSQVRLMPKPVPSVRELRSLPPPSRHLALGPWPNLISHSHSEWEKESWAAHKPLREAQIRPAHPPMTRLGEGAGDGCLKLGRGTVVERVCGPQGPRKSSGLTAFETLGPSAMCLALGEH